jgi:hypothetical protein
LTVEAVVRKCFAIMRALVKGYFWTSRVTSWKFPGSEPLQPDFDLREPVDIVPECCHQFLMDLFRSPSFQPEKLDEESSVLFRHSWIS